MRPHRENGFVVRIKGQNPAMPAGFGFLIGQRHVLTCAHVVNEALGRPRLQQGEPDRTADVVVEFLLLNGSPERRCRVERWHNPPERETFDDKDLREIGDLAVLEIADMLPEYVRGGVHPGGSGLRRDC